MNTLSQSHGITTKEPGSVVLRIEEKKGKVKFVITAIICIVQILIDLYVSPKYGTRKRVQERERTRTRKRKQVDQSRRTGNLRSST